MPNIKKASTKKASIRQRKKEFIRNLQNSLDNAVPNGYAGEIRTDNMSVYKKDADKFFKIFDKQLKIFRKAMKKN